MVILGFGMRTVRLVATAARDTELFFRELFFCFNMVFGVEFLRCWVIFGSFDESGLCFVLDLSGGRWTLGIDLLDLRGSLTLETFFWYRSLGAGVFTVCALVPRSDLLFFRPKRFVRTAKAAMVREVLLPTLSL